MQIYSVTVFFYVFLAIFTISHAFVFWIPIWKTTSVIRYHPTKGWTPIKTRGSSFIKPRKTSFTKSVPVPAFSSWNHHFNPSPPRSLRHFPSYFRPSVHVHSTHQKHRNWKQTRPLWDLNRQHPLCPLCHLPVIHKPRKPVVYGHSHQKHHHVRHHPSKHLEHFTPSDAYPKYEHIPKHHHFKSFSQYPGNNYFRQFSDFNPPRVPNYVHFPKIMYQFPRLSPPLPFHTHHKFRRHWRPVQPFRHPIQNAGFPEISHTPTQGSVTRFPKDFSNFGFTGFGSGSKGHGWGGWDW